MGMNTETYSNTIAFLADNSPSLPCSDAPNRFFTWAEDVIGVLGFVFFGAQKTPDEMLEDLVDACKEKQGYAD